LKTNTQTLITPNWPAPKTIHAVTTTRGGGVSQAPFESFNLAAHVGDQDDSVIQNRQLLQTNLSLPNKPCWLGQVHSTNVIELNENPPKNTLETDASFTTTPQVVCTVMSGDCLPVLVCNQTGTCVAAIHAGWRGLAAGVIEAAINRMPCDPATLLVWLGPAIGPNKFEVGQDVKDRFMQFSSEAKSAFVPHQEQHYLANIYLLAKQRLEKLGINQIYGGEHCTFTEEDLFFSHRRDKQTGRMASLIWVEV